jgi:hypothetical protein
MPAWGVLTTEQLVVMDTRLPRMPLRAELCSKTIQMANMAAPLMYAAMVVVKLIMQHVLALLKNMCPFRALNMNKSLI